MTDRLRSINPDALALRVGRALVEHYQRRAMELPPGLQLQVDGGVVFDDGKAQRLPADPRSVGVALTVADLARYAQSGDTADWGGPEGALDAAASVYHALYAAPADALEVEADVNLPWTERIEGDSDLSVVLRAACARVWAETGASDIPATWLAELAGITRGGLAPHLDAGGMRQTFVQRGRGRVAMVRAGDARKWLQERGILAKR